MAETEIRCACPVRDGRRCVEIRYNRELEPEDEPCECACHERECATCGAIIDFYGICEDCEGERL